MPFIIVHFVHGRDSSFNRVIFFEQHGRLCQPGRVDTGTFVNENRYIRMKRYLDQPTQGVAVFPFTGVASVCHTQTPFDPRVNGTDARLYRVGVVGIEQEALYHIGVIAHSIGVTSFCGPCRDGVFYFCSKKPVGDPRSEYDTFFLGGVSHP